MQTTDPTAPHPGFVAAGALLEALVTRDFERLAGTLTTDASLAALLPRGFDEWQGAAAIRSAFFGWFGEADEFEVVDASIGQVGSRLQLRWRIRVRAARFGGDPMVVEQNVYAETAPDGRIAHLALLCSGFCREHDDG
jgi:hypothetical protein